MDKKIKRRAVLGGIGVAGAALVTGTFFHSNSHPSERNGSEAQASDLSPPLQAEDIIYQLAPHPQFPEQSLRTLRRKLQETVSIKDFGAIGDGITDDTVPIQTAVDHVQTGGTLYLPAGTYLISDTITLPAGITIYGEGIHKVTIVMNQAQKFALNLFTPGTRTEYFQLGNFTLRAKYGITNRWDIGTNYEQDSNPSRTVQLTNIHFIGQYDSTDPLAQSSNIPDRGDLEALGVALHLVMVYGAEVKSCLFEYHGIAIENIGCTLSKFERNRFNRNARHIHDERVKWYLSSFGMGADNVYEQNDLLDATRVGGVTLWCSYGAELRHNYCEHLERGSEGNVVKSSPEMYLFYNTDACKFHFNHHNAYLSIQLQRPYMKLLFDGQHIGRASGNIIEHNTITAFSQVMDNFIDITTTKWDRRYPWHTRIGYQELSPVLRAPYVLTGGEPALNRMSFDQLLPQMKFEGSLAAQALPFMQDLPSGAWYLKPGNHSFRFTLHIPNPALATLFIMKITADDYPEASGGNGRLFVHVRDRQQQSLFQDYAFSGITKLGTYSFQCELTEPESIAILDIDLSNLSFCKVFQVEALAQE